MTFLRIVTAQALLLLVAALVARFVGGLVVALSVDMVDRPAGLLIVTLVNTLPYILVGSALSGLRYMTALRLGIAAAVFAALATAIQCLSIFVAAPSMHLTRYLGSVPLFLNGKVTLAGIVIAALDIAAATTAFFLASGLTGVYRKESIS